MRTLLLLGLAAITLLAPTNAWAQRRERKSEAEFVTAKPAVGDLLPDVVVYDVKGNPVNTADLRGHYTVITFGCLT